jgi:IS5 family transposase
MHQTKKGNQWCCDLKAQVGVDSREKIVHSLTATPANLHDSGAIADILHGDETLVWGDSADQRQREAIVEAAPKAGDFSHHRGNRASALNHEEVAKNRTKSRVRAHVEHPFRIRKCIFRFRKACYRGMPKSLNQLWVSCAPVKLNMKQRKLLRCAMACGPTYIGIRSYQLNTAPIKPNSDHPRTE